MQGGPAGRHVSLPGRDGTGNSDRRMAMLASGMARTDSQWVTYVERKPAEKTRMGADDLHVIGARGNTLSAVFEGRGHAEAPALPEHLEEAWCRAGPGGA